MSEKITKQAENTVDSMAGWVVELEKGVWVAPWSGDPGRTLVLENAKRFQTKTEAMVAMSDALTYRSFVAPKTYKPNVLMRILRLANILHLFVSSCQFRGYLFIP